MEGHVKGPTTQFYYLFNLFHSVIIHAGLIIYTLSFYLPFNPKVKMYNTGLKKTKPTSQAIEMKTIENQRSI